MDLPGRAPLTVRRALAAALVAAAVAGCAGPGPVAVPPAADAGPAAAARCAALHQKLPKKVGDLTRRRTEPSSDRTAAWGDPAVVLRCGVVRPAGYRPELTPLAEVNGVGWYQHIAGATIEWVAVDRPVYVQLDVPRSYEAHAAFLVDLAGPIAATLPRRTPG